MNRFDDMRKYVVVRDYSHTDKQHLWKVLSRDIRGKENAQDWLEWMQIEEGKKGKNRRFRLVRIDHDDE